MSLYANGFNININEIANLEFREGTQNGNTLVANVSVLYPFLKDMHRVIGEAIDQHDKKLGELQRTKANMN